MSIVSTISGIFAGQVNPTIGEIDIYDAEVPLAAKNNSSSNVKFQYFPEKINDSKSVEWASKTVPGASHPIYTFISGGERSVSFELILSNDFNQTNLTYVNTATRFMKPKIMNSSNKREDCNSNIKDDINKLRSFLYPEYVNSVAKPPPLLVCYLPNSGLIASDGIKDSIVGFLNGLDIVYESFHRDGSPRLVTLSIKIVEVVNNKDIWQYVDRKTILSGGKNISLSDLIGF